MKEYHLNSEKNWLLKIQCSTFDDISILCFNFLPYSYHGDDRMRVEKIHPAVASFSEAFTKVSQFYQQNTSPGKEGSGTGHIPFL